ncbi:MAG: gamma-glutamyltransferase [Pseudomonadota bacterium]
MKKLIIWLFCILYFPCFAAAPQPASGANAMVVSAHPLATQVGLNILKRGGNAIDAAVAMGYTLAVVDPCCGNIGGGGFMLLHLANGKNYFLNFREKAPLNINVKDYFKDGKPDVKKIRSGYLAVGVPGTVMGLNTALERFGTLSLQQVIAPAIQLAQQGFVIQPKDIKVYDKFLPKLRQSANVAKIFYPNSKALAVGDKFKQPRLAQTLTLIAKDGSKAFYQGPIAKAIVQASARNGGALSLKDFTDYTVEIGKPLICSYQNNTIITSPPPSSGGVTLCEMLNVLSAYPLKSLGFHSAASTHYIVEAMRYAYADRNRYLGDPDFINNPIEKLLSKQHAQMIRNAIKPFKAGNSKNMGLQQTAEPLETTSYAVVDSKGNAVSVTYTLNGAFGAKVIAGNTGFFLNNEMDDFTLQPGTANMFGLVQGQANRIQPGKRPLSSMTPTIVLKDNQVYLVLGAAGGSTIITQILQILLNVIDYNMNISTAIAAPRFHMQWLPDIVFMEPLAFSPDTQKLLRKMGYKLQTGFLFYGNYWGFSAGIQRDFQNKNYLGAADIRYGNGNAKGF